ncbi:GPW/gp25 family protein [Roseibium alexandrii]|uniref:GPW/gp25 family protein n=1 Tax=Roseibium alexandrii TaxID=388408 RepID=UPI0037506B43
MADIDRRTGQVIDNLASAFQSVEIILSTRIGSRLIPSRSFGAGVVELLGRLVTPALFAAFRQLIGTAIDLYEPRFKVNRIGVDGTAEELRLGTAGLLIEVDYRPRGQFGDFTVERTLGFSVSFANGLVRVV